MKVTSERAALTPDRPTSPDDASIRDWVLEATAEPPALDGWIDLIVQIRNIAEIDRKNADDSELPPGLAMSAAALFRVTEFLMKQPCFIRRPKDILPLVRLSSAMIDLTHGRVSPIFKPKTGKGSKGNGSYFEMIKGMAARALHEAVLAKDDQEDAARTIATACGRLETHGVVTAREIINWRNRLNAKPGPGAPKDGPARFAYWKHLPADISETPRSRADFLISELRRLSAKPRR